MKNRLERWSYVKAFLFVAFIIFLVVWILTSCSSAKIVDAQRGYTDSVWRVKKSTVYNVRIRVDSCTAAVIRWNVHCYCENYTIPQLWDVATLTNGNLSVKEVK